MEIEEKNESTLQKLINSIKAGDSRISIRGLSGSSKAFVLILINHLLKKPIFLITPSNQSAEALYNDLIFFSKKLIPVNNAGDTIENIFYFPQWEVTPYESLSPYIEISSKRLLILDKLLNKEEAAIVLITPESLLQRFMNREQLQKRTLYIEVGLEITKENLVEVLTSSGYERKDIVEEIGDFSSRGCIVDIFTYSYKNPLRIEFFGDEITSIREFDLYTQRSVNRLREVNILPVREIFYDPDSVDEIAEKFKKYFYSYRDKSENYDKILAILKENTYFPGIEYFSPLFFDNLVTIFDYIPKDSLLVFDEPLQIREKSDEFYKEINSQWEILTEKESPCFSPSELYISPEEIELQTNKFEQVFVSLLAGEGDIHIKDLFNFDVKTISFLGLNGGIDRLKSCLLELESFKKNNYRVYFVSSTEGYAKRLEEIFKEYDTDVIFNDENRIELSPEDILSETPLLTNRSKLPPYVPKILTGKLSGGFEFGSIGLVIISDEEIFGKKIVRRFRRTFDSSRFISDFGDLSLRDYLVHIDYGIGKFQGVKKIRVNSSQRDFLAIEYLGNEFLYVPVENLNLIQKYIGVHGSVPKLDHLSGKSWEKAKEKAKESICKIAKELLEISAARKIKEGFAFSKDDNWMKEFESTFEYEETPHQLKAIEDVKRDMESYSPMDRLICGDVGYGKTEVALRAALKAVIDGKQVAVLVPTTILAQQHYQTFVNRFSTFPIKIEVLSRFCSEKKEREIIKGLAEGKVDIVIGTHRLISDDVKVKDIGLIVIDEEQRFGVKHKEKLKKFRNEVDILTLTATPIPRTLQLSLMGVRDMSIIDTPPEDRQPIKTVVAPFSKELIAKAIMRELERGGQIYFVHNRVRSINAIERMLKKLAPSIRIGVAHGQMKKNMLEEVMMKFIKRDYDILLCTSIIESGLDIPSVNTIIINRADCFGLADLYQLRGRVGRDGHVSYAYLLIPPRTVLTEESQKRLRVIEELSDLGSGFKIAAQDLEIRGAGNILGEEQSGYIISIGFDLYCKLIEETISELNGISVEKEKITCSINSDFEAFIPDDFIGDSMQRMSIYKRLAEIEDLALLEEFKEEIQDRFGNLPKAVELLFEVSSLRILGNKIKASKVEFSKKGIIISFSDSFQISPHVLAQIISDKKNYLKFISENSLVIKNLKNVDELIKVTKIFLEDMIRKCELELS